MAEISRFPVHRIRFCARGQLTSSERECFALSFTQFNGTQANHQCHVFRCQVPEAVRKRTGEGVEKISTFLSPPLYVSK